MTAKEKAIYLIESFNLIILDTSLGGSNNRVKKCALKAVDEILNANGLHPNDTDYDYNKAELYWKEVKQEIEKL